MAESTNKILRQIRDGGVTLPSAGESTNDILRQIRDAGIGGSGEVDAAQNTQIVKNKNDISALNLALDGKANASDVGTSAALDLPPDDNQLYCVSNGVYYRLSTAFELDPKPTVSGVNRFEADTYEQAYIALIAHYSAPENAEELAKYDKNELRIVLLAYVEDDGITPAMTMMSRVGGVWIPTVGSQIQSIVAEEININELIGGQELIDRVQAVEEKLAEVRTYTLLLSGL